MRRRAFRAVVCLLIALAVPLALAIFGFCLPPQYQATYLGALPMKLDALDAAPSPRVVVAGGSGAAFNTRCDLLEAALPGYHAVNLGLYAGLGTTVTLDLALPRLREGDILVFSPELSAQTLSTYFGAEAMWQAVDGRFDLLAGLDGAYRGALVGAFPAFAASKARLLRDGSAPTGDGVYARDSFNAAGDLTNAERPRNRMPEGYDANMPVVFDPELLSEDFVAKVNAVADACARRGVKFYFRLCAANAAALLPGELDRADAFFENLRERLRCEVLGASSETVMDAGWFFDTNFHLNSAGAMADTAALIDDLKAALGDTSPTEIEIPPMPEPASAALIDGDSADADCFVYEASAGGWRVCGLSEARQARTRLVVPVQRDGLPVTGFDAATFAGNGTIEEIVIQANIAAIPDGAFSGCAALKSIDMRNPDPERCSVGAGLLDGTSAVIRVPAARLSAYRTNYFWAIHAARILPDSDFDAEETPQPEPSPVESAVAAPDALVEITYYGNGGTLKKQSGDSVARRVDHAHLRVNTLQGTAYFEREGYVLTGWNTAPDGGGVSVGLGSRVERLPGLTLYAQWAEAAPEADFRFEEDGDGVAILEYLGGASVCAVPERLGGLPVRRICAGAFRDCAFERLVLPSALRSVENGAFENCAMGELMLFDGLKQIGDAAFAGCEGPETLRVNACAAPVYSGSYYDTFSDKYDWLLSIRDRRKLVLASGSSGRYGYDSEALRRAFPDYEVANMGVYAWSNMRPQLELTRQLMLPGDILLSAPEFDAVEFQFCATDRLDAHFWAMMESNYDAAARLDMRHYSGVFDSFGAYLRNRVGMAGRSYDVSPANYDDDGNYYAFSTYNRCGDFVLPRPNGDADVRLRSNIADYTTSSFPDAAIDGLNAVYADFLSDGIDVYFSYTPRNRMSLSDASTPEARRALHEMLAERLCVPVISDIEDYLLPGQYFWLIDSHTSTEGASLRTRRLIADLRAAMAEDR